jgi:hypothetical protein
MDSNSVLRGFKLNKKQKLVLAIFVPIFIFFIALIIANSVGVTDMGIISEDNPLYKIYGSVSPMGSYIVHDPFNWEKTWYVWFLYVTFCCIFEYKLFADKKRKINN